MKEKNEILMIDPLEEHMHSYLSYMDEHKLKIRSILLTSTEKEYIAFMEDLRPMKSAFTDDFQTHAGFT